MDVHPDVVEDTQTQDQGLMFFLIYLDAIEEDLILDLILNHIHPQDQEEEEEIKKIDIDIAQEDRLKIEREVWVEKDHAQIPNPPRDPIQLQNLDFKE